jgi:hypothetical protein
MRKVEQHSLLTLLRVLKNTDETCSSTFRKFPQKAVSHLLFAFFTVRLQVCSMRLLSHFLPKFAKSAIQLHYTTDCFQVLETDLSRPSIKKERQRELNNLSICSDKEKKHTYYMRRCLLVSNGTRICKEILGSCTERKNPRKNKILH